MEYVKELYLEAENLELPMVLKDLNAHQISGFQLIVSGYRTFALTLSVKARFGMVLVPYRTKSRFGVCSSSSRQRFTKLSLTNQQKILQLDLFVAEKKRGRKNQKV
ncbi:hypothetical protein BpHYR1_010717 [Brachionus plicatilis]|uniref:Uncharacterized protein n=1 Tax=Brachionus plicatilis TaxID=10195 RepID=A0A3M7RM46_BRAPC|nr:hypothetical protein BpHYR1_010717 [Brachionus plicatilis]